MILLSHNSKWLTLQSNIEEISNTYFHFNFFSKRFKFSTNIWDILESETGRHFVVPFFTVFQTAKSLTASYSRTPWPTPNDQPHVYLVAVSRIKLLSKQLKTPLPDKGGSVSNSSFPNTQTQQKSKCSTHSFIIYPGNVPDDNLYKMFSASS